MLILQQDLTANPAKPIARGHSIEVGNQDRSLERLYWSSRLDNGEVFLELEM